MTIRKCWVCSSYANQLNCEHAGGVKRDTGDSMLFQLLQLNCWAHLLEKVTVM